MLGLTPEGQPIAPLIGGTGGTISPPILREPRFNSCSRSRTASEARCTG